MKNRERELKTILTGQQFDRDGDCDALVSRALTWAKGYAMATEGVAVLSDFHKKECHICSGKFGSNFYGLPDYSVDSNSAFESEIFNSVISEDILERHILEIRFFNFLKTIPSGKKSDYHASCILRLRGERKLTILHTTHYLEFYPNGNVWLALCTYVPVPQLKCPIQGSIYNIETGVAVERGAYAGDSCCLLSKRQSEILAYLAKGLVSKQVAERLGISHHTVNRHRQDILAALRVDNTTAAVQIALRLGII